MLPSLSPSARLVLPRLLVKAHISEYTRKDGTFVPAHEDKRAKHSPEQMAKWADEKRQRDRARAEAFAQTEAENKRLAQKSADGVDSSSFGPSFTDDEKAEIKRYYLSGDRRGANAEGRAAAVSAVGRLLRQQGAEIEHVSESEGKSLYVKVGGGLVRVSDHELPMTPKRENDRANGLTGCWDREVIITDWRSTPPQEYLDEIHGRLEKAIPVLFLKSGEFKGKPGYSLEGKPPRWHTHGVDTIQEVIDAARQPGHAPQKADLGEASPWLVQQAAEKAHLQIAGCRHVIDGSAVRHIIKRHTNAAVEKSRGQLPLTEADIEAIPLVIASADRVVFGTKTRLKRDQIGYIKKMADGSLLYLEEVRAGRQELATVSMRKYPAARDFSAIAGTLPSNARSDGGDEVIVLTPPVKGNPGGPLKKAILFVKAHIKGYTKKDGTFVAPHEDKRQAAIDHDALLAGLPAGAKFVRGKGSIAEHYGVAINGETVGNFHARPEDAVAEAKKWLEWVAANNREKARKSAFIDEIRNRLLAGGDATDVELNCLGLRVGSSDLRWFIPAAAKVFGISSRAVRPLIADMIRVGHTDMGAKREFVTPGKALRAVAAGVAAAKSPALPLGTSGDYSGPTMAGIEARAAEPATKQSVGKLVTPESDMYDGSTVYDGNGKLYRVHYQRNREVIAHPIVNGRAEVSRDTAVDFWVSKDRTPPGDNYRTDPIYLVASPHDDAPKEPAKDAEIAAFNAKHAAMGTPTAHFDDQEWWVLNTGTKKDDGTVYAHLASKNDGAVQGNGFVPRQMGGYIPQICIEATHKPHSQHILPMPTGVAALKPIGLTASNGGAVVEQIESLHAGGNLAKLKNIKANLFTPSAWGGGSLYKGAQKKGVSDYLDAAIADLEANPPGPPATSPPSSVSALPPDVPVPTPAGDYAPPASPERMDAAYENPQPVPPASPSEIKWDTHKLGPANVNAKSHNGQIDKIKALAEAGDRAGLEAYIAAKAGARQNYAIKQRKLAEAALAALGPAKGPEGGLSKAIPLYVLRRFNAAAHQAATSPKNDLPEPTQAQKESGNYKKGHVTFQGLDISIENPRGSERAGTNPNGTAWRHTMSDHYGYIKRTEGADGDSVDVYVGPALDSDRVFVVNQLVQGTGKFDEHKVMLGFPDEAAAVKAYKSNFDAGWKVGPVHAMSMAEFKGWLKDGDTTKPTVPMAKAIVVVRKPPPEPRLCLFLRAGDPLKKDIPVVIVRRP